MKAKNLFVSIFVFLAICMSLTAVFAETWTATSSDIQSFRVYVDGNLVWTGNCEISSSGSSDVSNYCSTVQVATPALTRGEILPVKVVFTSAEDLDNLKLKVYINGYREDLEDETGFFDVFEGNQYSKDLSIRLPADLDALDHYTLYVKLESNQELTGVDEAKIDLSVQRVATELSMLNVELLTQQDSFKPGSIVYADVVVKNTGNHDTDDLFVKLSISELGVSRTLYLGDLVPVDCSRCDKEDTKKVSVALTLPQGKVGTFTLETEVYNDDVSVKESKTITVQSPASISILPQITSNVIGQGKTGTYNIVLSNTGDSAETVSVNVIGLEQIATYQITPQTFTLNAGESKIVTVAVSVDKNAAEGDHVFLVKTTYGGNSKEMQFETTVKANVIDWGLIFTIIGIVLAIVIIVLLSLAIAKKNKVEEETPETYY